MRIESRHSSMPQKRPPSSMRAAIKSGYVNGGMNVRNGGLSGGSVGRAPSTEETPFDVSRHRVRKSTREGQKPVPPPYIGVPDPPLLDFDGKGALGIVVQTRGLVFNEEGFVSQQQDQQNPPAYVAGILIDRQKGFFAVGGTVRRSDELRMAVGDAGGSRQVEYVIVPKPYSPREIDSIVTNNGFVIVSLGRPLEN